jgi:GntR family transcriptional regulator/MocR family aminotransferase
VTLSAPRRLQLLEFAKKHRIAVLEDDYDHEFHYEGRPIAPISSEDSSGNLIYIGTLSKVLAPGLRIGYVVGPKALIDALAAIRSHIDSHGDAITETAVAEWIEEGDLERHARRVRRVYLQRRQALDEALQSQLGGAVRYTLPNGGMALWVQCLLDKDADGWAARALERGVRVSPASLYRLDRRNIPYMRMGFAKLNEKELQRAVKTLARSASSRSSA